MTAREEAEFLRAAYDAFNRGVQSGDLLSSIERFLDPEVEWRLAADQPDADQIYRGHEGVKRLFDRWLEAWDEWALEPEEFIDAGDAWVVPDRIHGRGRTSGVTVDVPYAHVFKLRGGKIVKVQDYSTKEQALQAVGLPRASSGAVTERSENRP
jgi:hypothetical protein